MHNKYELVVYMIYHMNITNVPLDFGNGKKFITSQPWCEFLSTASSVFIVGGSGNKLLFLAPLRFGRMLGTSLIFSLGVVELVTLHCGLKRQKSVNHNELCHDYF